MTTSLDQPEIITVPDDASGITPRCDVQEDDGPQCQRQAIWRVTASCPPCHLAADVGLMCAEHAGRFRTAILFGGLAHRCGRTTRPHEMTWEPLP